MSPADLLVIRAVRQAGPWLAALAATALLGAAAELLLPLALGRTLDALVAGGPGSGRWLTVSALLVVLVAACDATGVLASGVSGARSALWLRRRVVAHTLAVGTAMTRHAAPGEIVTRAGVNVEEAGRTPEAVVTAAALVVPSAGSVVALALIDPWLAATLVAGLLLIVGVLRAFVRRTTAASGGYQQAQGEIAARLVGALAGARTITAAGVEEQEARRVLAPLPRLRAHGLDLWRLQARAGVQAAVVVPLLETAVLAVGGLRLSAGGLTVGELLAAARYVVLGAGLGSAVGYAARLARARSAAARIERLLSVPPPSYGSRPLPPGPGRLDLRGVTVRAEDGATLLRDVDLVVPGGACVAVVGRSGSGKSSLAAVAGRLVDPERGTVLLDGVPLPEIGRRELRRAVGYAFERPALFGETLGDAVAFGQPVHDARRTFEAARAACADPFVRRLRLGYFTPVADAPMSGGEAQRIGLARAFAQAERLLILDDAMSSLDTATERQVARALTGSLGDRTRLVVAHRVATAARADLVVWLEDGRVRATGRHEALWEDAGYRAVFQEPPPPEEDPAQENAAREDRAREDTARENRAREDTAREHTPRHDEARDDRARRDAGAGAALTGAGEAGTP
ncbi:ABC transporter ATP-binding protein [Microbispora corallina]|uniref:ABC transporter ATP-binding protein n=1 Tax=Microbispora corallina TaxID=83302 RepID=A0ABQ4G538_9ACTN|nr:ABC transporter ATP-binding protein [Microbispora corallina]GIH42159.1 ABC transporter ATP-binding protein [Microbispora corallina]